MNRTKLMTVLAGGVLLATVLCCIFPREVEGQPSFFTGVVPLGTVLNFWNFDPAATPPLPFGYALCDGSPVTDPSSPFFGFNTPDLRDRFIYGTDDLSAIRDNAGGSATLNLAHSHGPGSLGFGGVTGISNNNVSIDRPHTGDQFEGVPEAHTHDFNSSSSWGNTDSALGTVSILPPYATLLKIIRYK